MNLESCFDFLSDSDIRIRGTRVGIETVLNGFLEGASPEEIAVRYRALSLTQVYATITFYLHNRQRIDAYLASCRQADEDAGAQQDEHPSDLVVWLRKQRQEELAPAKG